MLEQDTGTSGQTTGGDCENTEVASAAHSLLRRALCFNRSSGLHPIIAVHFDNSSERHFYSFSGHITSRF